MNDKKENIIFEMEDPYFGRMNDPTAAATIKGPCGDTMEVYLVIKDDVIEEVKYHTDGCGNTRSCGHAIARRALGRGVTDALSISAGELIRSGECQPSERPPLCHPGGQHVVSCDCGLSACLLSGLI